MTHRSFAAAIDEVLEPIGFTRQGKTWTRKFGTVNEHVGLQASSVAGTTANLWSYDAATNDLLKVAIPWKQGAGMVLATRRIGQLMNGYDRWWKSDPDGPTELAEAIRTHAPLFFEGRRSLKDQARCFGRAEPRWTSGNTASRIYLALTLYRMGEVEEACAVLQNPPKTAPASWLAEAESVRKWLERSPEAEQMVR